MITVRVREPSPGPEDEFGNPTSSWSISPWTVRAVAPGAMAEPWQANRDASQVAWTVYADSAPSEYAEVEIDGDWLPVQGRPSDWTRGPFGPGSAGFVVELARVEG